MDFGDVSKTNGPETKTRLDQETRNAQAARRIKRPIGIRQFKQILTSPPPHPRSSSRAGAKFFASLSIQLFRERLSEKMCTRQSRKVIWDMINTLFPTLLCSCRAYFSCFPLALAKSYFHGLSYHFFKFL